MRSIALVLAVCLPLATTGCSLLFMPKPDVARPMECTTSKKLPRSDLALGAMYILPAMILTIFVVPHKTCSFGNCEMHDGNPAVIPPLVVVGGLIVTHFYSAKVGYDRVGQCEQIRAPQMQQQPAPTGYPPPGAPPPYYPPLAPPTNPN
jgi:hypothetical protein